MAISLGILAQHFQTNPFLWALLFNAYTLFDPLLKAVSLWACAALAPRYQLWPTFWGHWDLRQTLNSLSHRAATRSEPTPTEKPQIESVVSLVKALWIERGCESLGSLRTGGSCWCSAWRVIQGSDTGKMPWCEVERMPYTVTGVFK